MPTMRKFIPLKLCFITGVRRRSRASALRRIPWTDPRLNAGLKLLDDLVGELLHRIAAVANFFAIASEHPWQNK